jgi:hypothetical protein
MSNPQSISYFVAFADRIRLPDEPGSGSISGRAPEMKQ